MSNVEGKNTNKSDEHTTTTYTINGVTATTIAAANADRWYFSAVLKAGVTDEDVVIRYYPAATDNLAQGDDVLTRRLLGNDNLFNPRHVMKEDIYTGEISAIHANPLGSTDICVTENP